MYCQMKKNLIWLISFCVLIWKPSESKTVKGKFKLEAGDLTHGPEYEITKYSFEIGEGVVEGWFKYADPHTWRTSPALYLFMDESWEAYHSAPSCMDKIKHAHGSIPIGKVTAGHEQILNKKFEKAKNTHNRQLADGREEFSFVWSAFHDKRTHGWFLVAADCALEQYNAQVSPMEYEIKLLNPGNTHLPADEYGLPKVYLFAFIGMSIFGANLFRLLWKQYSKSKDVHLVIILLLSAYFFLLVSVLYELVHLWVYKGDGIGVFFCDFMSEVLEGMSHTVTAFVLICLASGWTLISTEFDKARGNSVGTLFRDPKRLLEGSNAAIFGLIAFVMGTFLLQIMNKTRDDDFTKFHDFETTPGLILVLLRLVLGVLFLYSLHVTIKFQEARGGEKLLMFMKRLRLWGGLWFLSFPCLVGFASLFPHYLRHRIVSTGVLTLQASIVGILGYEFVSESSTYFKLSVLADTGVLPGAGGFIQAPKASKA
eukprot:maker-scaffold_2-snap-gene-5.62-mRNA-1 protein AED:0.01 eAED:0.01 QI:119/1/1/1/1/1/4/359/482